MLTKRGVVSLFMSAALLSAPLVACGSSGGDSKPAEEGQTTQVANPFVDCESAYDAAQLAGFDVSFPESVPGYAERHYQAVEGQLAQCLYGNGDKHVIVRKGVGEQDISGDYDQYAESSVVSIANNEVTEKGEGGQVRVATWTRDGHSFAIVADEGLDPTVIEWLVEATL